MASNPTSSTKPDEFVWLEPTHSEEALKWAEIQDKTASKHLEAQPDYSKLLQELKQLAEVNAPRPSFHMARDLIFMLEKTATNRRGVLKIADRRQDASALEWRTILDVDELGRVEDKKWEFSAFGTYFPDLLFPNSKRLLIRLSDGGADTSELRELDMETGKFVEDGFNVPLCLMHVVCLDMDHVLIGHTLDDSPKANSGFPITASIWKRGTPLKDAKQIFSGETSDALVACFAIRIGNDPLACVKRYIDFSTISFHLVSGDGTVNQVSLPQKLQATMATANPHLIVSLREPEEVEGKAYPKGAILAYDTSPGITNRVSVVYIPADGEFVTQISKGGPSTGPSAVTLTFKGRGSETYLTLYYENGAWHAGASRTTAPGLSCSVLSSDSDSNDTIVLESGLLTPGVMRLESPGCPAVKLYSQPAAFDSSLYKVDLKVADSKDGTEVDYYLIQKKGDSKGQIPVLMTGYGGFAISYPIDYLNGATGSISIVPWLERGGAIACTLIRGGSERGEAWHEGAMREKRQNAFDDFIAVGEKMIQDGTTTTKQLGIYGSSNGGLLTAVMATQRPDLFGAIVSGVPLTDMLRFPSIGMGALWTHEFGDPAHAEDVKFLRAYSPFHNVKSGTKYPPLLVTTATDDDRVGVGHARKFVARLRQVKADVLYLEDRQGGHHVGDPFKNTAMLAKRMTFFIGNLM